MLELEEPQQRGRAAAPPAELTFSVPSTLQNLPFLPQNTTAAPLTALLVSTHRDGAQGAGLCWAETRVVGSGYVRVRRRRFSRRPLRSLSAHGKGWAGNVTGGRGLDFARARLSPDSLWPLQLAFCPGRFRAVLDKCHKVPPSLSGAVLGGFVLFFSRAEVTSASLRTRGSWHGAVCLAPLLSKGREALRMGSRQEKQPKWMGRRIMV